MPCIHQHQKQKRSRHVTSRILDKLWGEIVSVLPAEKPGNTVGRSIVHYRKVMDGIVYVLRMGCHWKVLPKEYGFGSTCQRRFQEWAYLGIFKKVWTRLLKAYDDKKGIKWMWQSLDSISIKSPLGGGDARYQSHG
jgi:transposase